MANYFVSYDLNGQTPTHAKMDEHLKKLGNCVVRVLETVWYVKTTKNADQLYEYANSLLSTNDRLLVVTASSATWRNLLPGSGDKVEQCWNS
jgi:hypothetical protein